MNQRVKLTKSRDRRQYNPKRYIWKKTRTKTQGPDIEVGTDFKGQYSDLEGYISNIIPIDLDKFGRMMKELEQYLGATYINICQPDIMTKARATFTNPDMPTVIMETGVYRTKNDVETTYLKKNNINEAIHQK